MRTFICIRLHDPNLFTVQVFVALKLPTIRINKAKGDMSVRGSLAAWKDGRDREQSRKYKQCFEQLETLGELLERKAGGR